VSNEQVEIALTRIFGIGLKKAILKNNNSKYHSIPNGMQKYEAKKFPN
jgi:ribosomal protein S13